MVKAPAASVAVAMFVPLTVTEAKATGKLVFELVTVPDTFLCANKVPEMNMNKSTVHTRTDKRSSFCLISGRVWLFDNLGRDKINYLLCN